MTLYFPDVISMRFHPFNMKNIIWTCLRTSGVRTNPLATFFRDKSTGSAQISTATQYDL